MPSSVVYKDSLNSSDVLDIRGFTITGQITVSSLFTDKTVLTVLKTLVIK